MTNDTSIELLARIRNGDDHAAHALFERFADRLIALADSRISEKLARRVDAEDVVQSVYRSFFVNARRGRYTLTRGGDLWQLLVSITLHKVKRQAEWHEAAKRAMNKEQPSGGNDESSGCLSQEALAREPSPLEAAALADEVEHILQQVPPEQQQVLELRLQGCNQAEIAEQLHCSERTVRRVLDSIRRRLAQRTIEAT